MSSFRPTCSFVTMAYPTRGNNDCGVAVYLVLDGRQQCRPCDRWTSLADKVQAIRKTAEALRGLGRWGAKSMVDAAFRGFEALPPPDQERSCWDALGIDHQASQAEIDRARRRRARNHHPDHGGSDRQMAEINAARDIAMRQVTS